MDTPTIAELEQIVQSGNIPTLLMVVYQFTGDPKWLRDPYRPTRSRGLSDHDTGGLPLEVQDQIRKAAARAFHALLSGKRPKIEAPDAEQSRVMLSACVGERVDESCGEMFSQEFRRRLDPSHDDVETHPKPSEGFRVLVIGAGVSGIIAAEGLSRLGIPYLLVDRHSGPGGNWG